MSSSFFQKIKTFRYLLKVDKERALLKLFLKKPFSNTFNFISSLLKKETYIQSNDLYFFGIKDLKSFKELIVKKESLMVVGFSYCHRPLDCPKTRFSNECLHDNSHPVCKNCFIGSSVNKTPNMLPIFITDVYTLGKELFKIIYNNPGRKINFLITACPFSLKMFSFCSNMLKINGIGISLKGSICPSFKAFELAEKGFKNGKTEISEEGQKQILDILSTTK
ncbi:MAG: hypothetical protein HZB76_06540 [Chlamydiae bacterium]|nr:hypothetical protein [Chlamydiota bacterium]